MDRTKILEQRQSLSATYVSTASHSIIQQILDKNLCGKAQHIGFYWPHQNEIDLRELSKQLPDKNFYLPCLTTSIDLTFHLFEGENTLAKNRFDIPEPQNSPTLATENLDIVFVPGVAFDKHNNRVGMGKGYYDRTFAFTKEANTNAPVLIGVCYGFQMVERIKAQAWDVMMDGVLTGGSEV